MPQLHAMSILASVVLLLAGCGTQQGPADGSAQPKAGTQEPALQPGQEPPGDSAGSGRVITLTRAEFCDQVKDREAAAKQFAGAEIELEGVIAGMLWADETPSITLKVEERPTDVVCETIDREPWAKFSRGQKVTVRGRWPGVAWPTLTRCVVTSKQESLAVKASAHELARQYQADPEGTAKKYQWASLILDGEVVAKEAKENVITIILKGDGASRIACEFHPNVKSLIEKVEAGAHLTVHGRFDRSSDGKQIKLLLCLPIRGKR